MSETDREPLVSVVISTPDTFVTVRAVVGHLRAQSLRDRLELVLVCPDPATLGVKRGSLDDFASVQIVEADPLRSLSDARASGVRAATGEIVAFVEDHAFPADGWAQALVDAHADGHAAVGSVMINLNPRSAVSWTDLFLSYGRFVEGARSGVVDSLPGDNGSYKRSLLLEVGPALVGLLDDEAALHRHLREQGYSLYLEARARLLHLNFSRVSSWLRLRYHGGRAYGGERARREHWGLVRRLLRAGLAVPGIVTEVSPVLLAVRGNAQHSSELPRMLPALALGLLAGAAGKLVGYTAGPGTAPRTVVAFSFHRPQHMRAEERSLAAPP